MNAPNGLQGAIDLESYTVIYGGSFDPPHVGHQMLCVYLLESLGADAVWLVPAYTHAFDKPLSSFEDRLAMCERMARFLGERVRVDPVERDLNDGGRTLTLIRELERRHPDKKFALAVGADIVGERNRWYRWEEIESSVPIVVVGRTGYESDAAVELPEVSSTEIRSRAAKRLPLIGLVPRAVAEWIERAELYGDDP
ncbi:MAG: nicotinate-nicotinamide nucleotide adenylyltransferase [Myxococcota bacterium]